ncbi:MAG: response regulator transcription factor [Saprospiraceae bacterium]|nr:response regulator transcription factor [Saprospiraceae bacterium]
MKIDNIYTIIIEDEYESQSLLSRMLELHCKNIKICGIFNSVTDAVNFIKKNRVDLIFLDIELPSESGFSLFEYFPLPRFFVIFTTAYNKYAVKAFKFSAIDYILKPIDYLDLIDAVSKFDRLHYLNSIENTYQVLISNMKLKDDKRFAVNHQSGFDMIDYDEVLWLEADVNYTRIHMISRGIVTIAKTLKLFEDYLDSNRFFRISRSAIVNIDYIIKFHKSNSFYVTLIDKTNLQVSESRKDELLALYDRI